MPPARELVDVVYSSSLDDLSSRLFRGKTRVEFDELRPTYLPELAKVAEALVLSERVVLKISGQNLVIPILLDYFKFEVFDELMRSGALQFLAWTHGVESLGPVVMGMPSPNVRERDVASMVLRDLTVAFPGIDKSLRDYLVSEVSKRAIRTEQRDAENAVVIAAEFAERGVFGDSIPGRQAFHKGSDQSVTDKARRVAEDLFQAFVVLTNEFGGFDFDSDWDAVSRIGLEIANGMGIVDAVESVYVEAQVPSVRDLLQSGHIGPQDIATIRRKPETDEFRRCLWCAGDPTDGPQLAEAFLSAMDRRLDPKDGRLYRLGRVLVTTAFSEVGSRIASGAAGAALGAAAQGTEGALIGAFAGLLAGTSLNLAEPFVPDYFKKPDPLLFTDGVLRPYSKRRRNKL